MCKTNNQKGGEGLGVINYIIQASVFITNKKNNSPSDRISFSVGLWCLTPLSTVSFIDGGNRSTRRKPPTDKLSRIMLYRPISPEQDSTSKR